MKTLVNLRASTWLLLLGLGVSFIGAAGLPTSWGWENGPLENFQALTLLVGALAAWLAAYQQRDKAIAKIWLVAAFFWLGMLGRELAWGAVFLPPLGLEVDSGPTYSSSVLWWKPAVLWVCLAMLLTCIYWVLRYDLLGRVVLRWWRDGSLPWGCLLVFVLAMVLGSVAEGHIGAGRLSALGESTRMAMEEMSECWAYLALWWGQWRLIMATQQWRSAGYMHTLYSY